MRAATAIKFLMLGLSWMACVDAAMAQSAPPGRWSPPGWNASAPEAATPPETSEASPPTGSVAPGASDAPSAAPVEQSAKPPSASTSDAAPPSPAAPSSHGGQSAAPVRAAPLLLVSEGLEPSVSVQELRRRLGEALGREVVSLTDANARQAQASVWVSMDGERLVVRVASVARPEVWRQLERAELGADPAGLLVRVVVELLWADAFARADQNEIRDPYCPPGVICIEAGRAPSWPSTPDLEVLDPWDSSYRRFYDADPFWYAGGRRPGEWEAADQQGRPLRAGTYVATQHDPQSRVQHYAIGLLAGGGVHEGGAFLRYEVNALRRFRRFDFGLTYVADRGQPEPFQKARRTVSALLERRFVTQDFELDLGANFGMFFANFSDHPMVVRPYLRGLVTFALPLGRSFDLLVQSDLGTTFVSVPGTGLAEYALSMGVRHRM